MRQQWSDQHDDDIQRCRWWRKWALPVVGVLVGTWGPPLRGQAASPQQLLGRFEAGWRDVWRERVFGARRNSFELALDGGDLVLEVRSARAAGGLWRALEFEPSAVRAVSWRWRVADVIPGNTRERERRGDDYVARLFVMFEAEPFSRRSRAICYVWASAEPLGAVFRSPYAENVAMVVLESGTSRVSGWVGEVRDAVADYVVAFGRNPTRITGVAVMVDTDDTQSRAIAWYDDIEITFADSGPQPPLP